MRALLIAVLVIAAGPASAEEIFDKVYPTGSLSRLLKDAQTITMPPGEASIVAFKLDAPGNYVLVDHAMMRTERGLAGILKVDGPPNDAIFEELNPQRSAQSTSGH